MAVIFYSKTYEAIRGVDYSASPSVISDEHASDLLNMYIAKDGVLQKRPGFNYVHDFSLPINGIHHMSREGQVFVYVHAGDRLYTATVSKAWRNFSDLDYGDVQLRNGDTLNVPTITADDANQIESYYTGAFEPGDFEDWQIKNMDLNGDGVIDEQDAWLWRSVFTRRPKWHRRIPTGIEGAYWYAVTLAGTPPTENFLFNQKSLMFDDGKYLYICDGNNYYRVYDTSANVVDGYIPTTAVGGYYKYDELNEEGTNPPGSEDNPGVWQPPKEYEKRNLIQCREINTFIADGIHHAYYTRQNNNTITKVELYLWTRCETVDGVVTPTQENKDHVDAGTYNGHYYYYTYVWTEISPTSAFSDFDSTATYAVGDKVKYSSLYYACKAAHTGEWSSDDFTEVYAYDYRNADSTTPLQNKISYSTRVYIHKMPPVHDEGSENIRVTYENRRYTDPVNQNKQRGYITKCTCCAKYGYYNNNRYFLGGNPDHRNMDFASAVDDPTYFPSDGWTAVGSKETMIMGYIHYGSDLLIIKEDNEKDATIYVRSARVTDDNEVLFPVKQGAESYGAISKYAILSFKDDPVFLAKEGLYAVEAEDTTQERSVKNRSFYVDSKLRDGITSESIMAAWGDYMIVAFPNGRMYVADSRYTDKRNGSFVYNWCVWQTPFEPSCMHVVNEMLLLGEKDGTVWVLHDTNPFADGLDPISAMVSTKTDHLGSIELKKTMLLDGGYILLKPFERSSAAITVTTDKGEIFVDDVQTDSDEPSVVVPIRCRVKNFDWIQTKIENRNKNEGLALIAIQYRYAMTTNRR